MNSDGQQITPTHQGDGVGSLQGIHVPLGGNWTASPGRTMGSRAVSTVQMSLALTVSLVRDRRIFTTYPLMVRLSNHFLKYFLSKEDSMPKAHDRGGWPCNEPIEPSEHEFMDWERRMDALHTVLGHKGVRTTDEMRRAIESLEPSLYEALSYYEKWTAALEILTVEKGILSTEEIDKKMASLENSES